MRIVRSLLMIVLMCAVPLYGFAALLEQCRCDPRQAELRVSAPPCHGRHAGHHEQQPVKQTHCKFGEKCQVGNGLNQTALQWTAPLLPHALQIFAAPSENPPALVTSAVWRPPRI